jgi:hypothetical protein
MSATKHALIREVTDKEVDFFFENGWVKLPGLIDAEFTADLLEGAKRVFGENGDKPLGKDANLDLAWFRTHDEIAEEDERFGALASESVLGYNAARLFGRISPIRLMQNSLMVKLPSQGGAKQTAATAWHQDTGAHMFSDANSVNVWVALDKVESNMGAMQFYSGSHKLGNLGNLMDPEIWAAWQPRLERSCTLTDPIELEPGDVTIHTHFMVHGTQANNGSRPRWAWGAMLLPADARYTGAKSYYTDGLGLEPFGANSLEHPKFPVIYTPEA